MEKAMNDLPEWAKDALHTDTSFKFDLKDRLRILLTGRMRLRLRTVCENPIGRMDTDEAKVTTYGPVFYLRELRRRLRRDRGGYADATAPMPKEEAEAVQEGAQGQAEAQAEPEQPESYCTFHPDNEQRMNAGLQPICECLSGLCRFPPECVYFVPVSADWKTMQEATRDKVQAKCRE